MQYKLEKIDTVEACDVLLISAQKKKQNLERRRRNLGESIDTFRERMDRMVSVLSEVNLSLDVFSTAYEALPEGKDKASMNVKVKRLELRQAQLEKKALTYNVAALLVKEMKYNALDSQVSVLEHYIAAVQYRRMVLTKTALRISQAATFLRPPVVRFSLPQDLLQAHLRPIEQVEDHQSTGERSIISYNNYSHAQKIGVRDTRPKQ